MQRVLLKYILGSGSSRVLDVRRQHHETGSAPLFRTGFLNSAILLKQSGAPPVAGSETLPPISIKVFMPYDRERPDDGGKSFMFTPNSFRKILAGKTERGTNATNDDLDADLQVFLRLNEVPTFSAYLAKDVFDRAKLKVPNGYFDLPDAEAQAIRQRAQTRLRSLVTAALANAEGTVDEGRIDELTQKLWELADLEELEIMIGAFGIKKEEAPELFYSWLGLAFFEGEYIKLQPRLAKLAAWIGGNTKPRDQLSQELLLQYKDLILRTRKSVQTQWKTALQVLTEYSQTYEMLIKAEGPAQRFIDFLKGSKEHFWTLGDRLSQLEQSVGIWEQACSHAGDEPFNYKTGHELFSVIHSINSGSMPPSQQPKANAA